MSVGFKAAQWNRRKLIYDGILIACIVLFTGTFMTVGALRNPPADVPAWINLRVKAFGTCAFTRVFDALSAGAWGGGRMTSAMVKPSATIRASTGHSMR